MPERPLSGSYRDQRYLEGNTGWDMGHVSPPLRDYFEQLPRKDLAILIPDLLVEQTFFCALDPARRPQYVDQAAQLLHPGGKLAGLLFERNFAGGPPFRR